MLPLRVSWLNLTGWPPRRGAALALLTLGSAARAGAQAVTPPSPPPRVLQDDLDLQARSNVVEGSGARALGMGGAFLARADDATAASWNPAGLSYLRRPEVSLVWAPVNSLDSLERDISGNPVSNDQRWGSTPDFAAFTYPVAFRSVTGAAQISFQRVIAFAGDRTIDTPGTDREVTSSGGFDVLALGSGLQVTRAVRLGFTVNRWLNGYDQSRFSELNRGSTRQDVSFKLSGWNANFGVIVSPWQSLNLGAKADTPFTAKVDLARTRVDTVGDVATFNGYESDAVRLDFPGAIGVGASWRPRSVLTVSADYTLTFWSSGQIHNFFTLPRTIPGQLPQPPQAPTDVFGTLPYPSLYDTSGLGQTNTQQIRFGGEYVLIGHRLKIPLRAGFFLDRQYFRALDGRPPTFTGLTAGTGVILGPVLLDAAYVYEFGDYDSLDVSGNQLHNTVRSHRLYLSLIYRHGGS